MTELTRDDLLHLLATRHEMIEPLCDHILDKQVIQERVDVSRPTVDRAFREFEELGLLASTGTTYEMTRFGRLFCDRLKEQLDGIDELVELASLLSHLPESTSIDNRLLSGAEVIQSEPHAPLSPITELGKHVSNAEEILGYSNVILPHSVNFFHRRVLEEGVNGMIILSEGVMDRALSNHSAELADLAGADGFSLVRSDETLPYGILVIDSETVGVTLGSQEHHLRGALVNHSPEAVEWAEEQLADLEAGGEEYDVKQSGDSAFAD